MFNFNPCFLYSIPWILALLLTTLLIERKRTRLSRKRRWLHKLLRLFGGSFIAIGLLGFPISALRDLSLSFFGAGSLIINFTVLSEMAEMADDKSDSKNNEV